MLIHVREKPFELTGCDEDVELVGHSVQFSNWLQRMDPRFQIQSITVQAIDRRFDGGLLFAKLYADVTDEDGRRVPGAVFLRGDAVGMLIVLTAPSGKWVVLTVQPRFPSGQFESVEIPAGMMDDEGDFAGTAAREIKEETGISIHRDELRYLGEFFPSCGGTDEKILLYACEKKVSDEEIRDMQGRVTGAHHEHERIRLRIVPLDRLQGSTNDPKALLACGWLREMDDG